MRKSILLSVALGVMGFAAPAHAQSEGEQNRLVYDSAFFDPISPATALDMVERVPGFTVESGASGVRGFSQAAGNVVINGQRPSSKGDTLATILARIPASRVLRIEVGTGNAYGADYVGKSQVVNVVLTDESGFAGTLEAKFAREFTGSILPTLGASLLANRGDLSVNASVKLQNVATSEEGFDRLIALPSGETLGRRDVFSHSREPYKVVSFGLGYEPAADRSAHLNARVSIDPWDIDQMSEGSLVVGGGDTEVFTMRHVWKSYELSGDVTRPLLGGAIKLNFLAMRRDRAMNDTIVEYGATDLLGGVTQDVADSLNERVVRASWTRPTSSNWVFEVGAEGAFNRLRSETDLYTIDDANERTLVDLPIDDAVVAEYRAEAFANAGHDISERLHLTFGLTYETSRLTVSGDVNERRSLRFFKPNASIDWRSGSWHAQFSIKRTVAQLDFADFVSGADVDDGQVDGGNSELVPQRAWELLFTADRPVLGDGRIKVDLGYERVSDVQDRIPIDGGFDAPGNLGDGSRWIAKANLDLPLDRFAIKGGRLSLEGSYVDTSVIDPYTLLGRDFTDAQLFVYTAKFRQDLGNFAWEVEAEGNTGSVGYRRNELDRLQTVSPDISAFVEYRPTETLIATLGVENLLDAPVKRWRDLFAPDRTTLEPFRTEYRERNKHMLWYFSIKWNFG